LANLAAIGVIGAVLAELEFAKYLVFVAPLLMSLVLVASIDEKP
jgi:hypothetical protein